MVNMLEAKTHLSRLVEAIESREQSEVVIARNGRPARSAASACPRGAFKVPASIDAAFSSYGAQLQRADR